MVNLAVNGIGRATAAYTGLHFAANLLFGGSPDDLTKLCVITIDFVRNFTTALVVGKSLGGDLGSIVLTYGSLKVFDSARRKNYDPANLVPWGLEAVAAAVALKVFFVYSKK